MGNPFRPSTVSPSILTWNDDAVRRIAQSIDKDGETRSTIMTSNRPLEDWGKLLGDVPSATAILDRFLHHADLIELKGKSYRLNHRSVLNNAAESEAEDARRRAKPAPKEGAPSDSKPASAKGALSDSKPATHEGAPSDSTGK